MPHEDVVIPRELVARHLAVSTRLLISYESHGLLTAERVGSVEGYRASTLRRLWTIVSLHRDLGINLAGIEAILRLRAEMETLHARLRSLSQDLREALDESMGSESKPGPT